jgi:glycosyltransferase involved in cell wall biosynthesis
MRIALLAPLVSPIAPPYLGGTQALLADLAAGLAHRGHAITLYAADGSAVPGVAVPELGIDWRQLTPVRLFAESSSASSEGGATTAGRPDSAPEETPRALDDDDEALIPLDPEIFLSDYAFLRAYRAIAADAAKHDLVHAHAYDVPAFAYSSLQPLPIVHTLHLPALDPGIQSMLALTAPPQTNTSTRLVTVSKACSAGYTPFCRIDAVIYNGIPVDRMPYADRPAGDGYLVYAGRISPEKGVHDALEIAHAASKHLVLAGGIYDQEYYAERIEPWRRTHPAGSTYLGALPRERLWELMAGAEALLVPSYWDEPFGLVAVEAEATGTPVIGYARGGLVEVVAEGSTGWLVAPGDKEAAAEAVARISALDRAACRAWVLQHFSLDAMLDAYVAFYAHMLEDQSTTRSDNGEVT